MTMDRYERPRGLQPGGMAATLVVSTAMVSGLVMSSPIAQRTGDKVFEGINIPIERPKPEPVPEIKPVVEMKTRPTPRDKPVDISDAVSVSNPNPYTASSGGGTIDGVGIQPIETILPPLPTPTPSPVLTAPSVDPRFARDFQPNYPAGEQRAGRGGLVTIRILVGADGRVKQVERVSAASEAFFATTERQALTKWRFRPATRDGVAVEGWRTMTVRFEIGS